MYAGRAFSTGSYNVAIGFNAMANSSAVATGDKNTCVGYDSMSSANITSAARNTTVGWAAMYNITTGSKNCAIGEGSAYYITTGDNNICIGLEAGQSGSPSGSITTADNNFVLGNNSISNLYCADTSISSSDKRDKTDIEEFTHGLDWITEMKPVTYRWDRRTWYATDDNPRGVPDGSKKRDRIHIGFLAQDAIEVEKKFGYAGKKDDMLIVNQDEDENDPSYGYKYERLVPVLVNAVKELSAKVEALESKLNN